MAEEEKRADVKRKPISEEESEEEVVNDSMGTVDLADSTGLDSVDPTGGGKTVKPSGRPEDNA
jgi:hypothetical protein